MYNVYIHFARNYISYTGAHNTHKQEIIRKLEIIYGLHAKNIIIAKPSPYTYGTKFQNIYTEKNNTHQTTSLHLYNRLTGNSEKRK